LITNATRWRWVFYINVPIGIIALIALLIYLPMNISVRSSAHSGWNAVRRIDFPGAFLIAAATICLLLGLTWGSNQSYDWGSAQVIGIMAGSAALYAIFFVRERFAAEPVLPLDLFRNQVFASAAILSFLQLMILVALLIYLPLFLQGVLGISATDSGAVITPMTISSVIGASLAGFLIASVKRYHLITIVGSLIMTAGVILLATMTASTSLFTAGVYMVIAGLGLGVYFSVLNLAAQNAIPRSRLGVGTGSVRFLGQLGGVLGVAIVGTVVNNTISSDIVKRLPVGAVKQLTPAGLQYATNPQILVNSQYHDTVVHAATSYAVKSATAHVPPGPHHAQTVAAITAQVTQQVQHLLAQVFDALRLSLAVAIQHGMIAILIFCGLAIIATLFLKDIPMVKSYNTGPVEASPTTESKEDLPVNPL
jgi:predicted MFS family arabinose efflux permease